LTAAEFRSLVSSLRAENPIWFALETDPPATEQQIRAAEERLNVTLPESYKSFLREYGGGYFAFGNVFSVAEGSDWNIEARNGEHGVDELIAFSDNGVGDYFCFRTKDGRCGEQVVFLDHETGSVQMTEYEDIFEYLARVALRP
jgi:hypothetical protein